MINTSRKRLLFWKKNEARPTLGPGQWGQARFYSMPSFSSKLSTTFKWNLTSDILEARDARVNIMLSKLLYFLFICTNTEAIQGTKHYNYQEQELYICMTVSLFKMINHNTNKTYNVVSHLFEKYLIQKLDNIFIVISHWQCYTLIAHV